MALSLIIGVICGAICSAIAASKGRSAVGWFFCGFLIGIIGLIIILCMSNLNEQRARDARVDMENRRLREQLRQERIKAEVFRQHTQQRLDMHDQSLGIDTRGALALEGGGAQPAGYLAADPATDPAGQAPGQRGQAAPQTFAAQPAMPGPTPWYYEWNGSPIGPVTLEQIRSLVASRRLPADVLVWCENLPDWAPASRVPEFRGIQG